MTEPTDDELDAVLCNQWPAFSMQATLVRMWVRAAMRDAIAKWGQPAQATEPVSHQYQSKDGTWHEFIDQRHYNTTVASGGWPIRALYTTPQPTQPQAGAVPLQDEQLAEMMRDTWGCASIAPRHALEFARAVERAHGIT